MSASSSEKENIVIVGAARTAMGGLLGIFQSVNAITLGAAAIKAAVERATVDPEQIDEVFMGCVLPAGLGQAPARQAAIQAGIPNNTGAVTINKVCGSSMKAIMLGCNSIKTGEAKIIVAGGMESMTGAPYLLDKARGGYRLGHAKIQDSMLLDGLEDAYDKGKSMGVFAEATAEKFNFTREEQDAFALESLKRAQNAIASGKFTAEIVPVVVKTFKSTETMATDEQPGKGKPEKIPQLKPAFKENGTVTAANSSSISDGAAAVVLMTETTAKQQGIRPLARILGYTTFAQEPAWFTTAPVGAIKKLLRQTNKNITDIDLFEINEAFAVVTMAAMKSLDIPHDKVNIHGGACALGHPIGASGARIVVTLLSQLAQYGKKLGIAALCIGGGEATALLLERCD
jgi:acetyl-CoA C-acetyltransferase